MRADPTLQTCPRLSSAFTLFGKRWSATIVDLLLQRPARFAELDRALPGVSPRVLTERLRELEQSGILVRSVSSGPPIAVTYSLTRAGEQLRPAMDAMREWAAGLDHEQGPAGARAGPPGASTV